jgi:hypothetical protein
MMRLEGRHAPGLWRDALCLMELPLWAGTGKLGDPKRLSVREGGGGLALRLGIPR